MEREAIQKVERWMSDDGGDSHEEGFSKRAELLCAILDDHHGNNRLRLTYICTGLRCTMRSVEREFKTKYGESMYKMQKRLRMERIEWYLRKDPEIKLSALAVEMGYDRLSEFSRYFRKQKGMTPGQYLKTVIIPELAREEAEKDQSSDT